MSNIRVSVQWAKPTVFAGEEVECIITFKNVAPIYSSRSPSPNTGSRRAGPGRDRWRLEIPKQNTITGPQNTKPTSTASTRPRVQGHRSTLSLSTHPEAHTGISNSLPGKASTRADPTGSRHKRSVSILSISQDTSAGDTQQASNSGAGPTQVSVRQHGRSASFQGVSQRSPLANSVPSGTSAPAYTNSRLSDAHTRTFTPSQYNASRAHQRTSSRSPAGLNHPFQPRSDSGTYNGAAVGRLFQQTHSRSQSFRFPQTSSGSPTSPNYSYNSTFGAISPRPHYEEFNGDGHERPAPNVLSSVSISGTPRSSLDFYTTSNNSSETLASEYISTNPGRQPGRNGHSRQPSHLAPIISHSRPPETLMMGYVQLMGSFTLDASLVNSAPFENVKRKGVIGGQGSGGVVGVEPPKKESGLFGALGWGTIGESLGGLLGGSELSSIREMKGIANTNSVPIISTPQSILFVDLKLAPGERRSFSYSHVLPQGIPPTHKGRAMKIVYQIVIGTQRAQSAAQQHIVKHVNVPFRVLAGVNGNGEILGHDLMQPHILLKNTAHSEPVNNISRTRLPLPKATINADSSPDDLQTYVESLLDKPRHNSSLGLLSPTELPTPSSKPSYFADTVSMKDIIDFAIVKGNAVSSSQRSANKFQIQRGGEKVAVIMLARPAYRLGETVTAVVDFGDASLCCYSLHASLETSEVVDPAIALRSSSSIHRATRRVYATSIEDTLFAQRATFSAMIPTNTTPEFFTSGIELQWQLRFEFLTGPIADTNIEKDGLLEEVASDDRGTILAAVQNLPCETFDVAVPIRVYGTDVACDDRNNAEEYSI